MTRQKLLANPNNSKNNVDMKNFMSNNVKMPPLEQQQRIYSIQSSVESSTKSNKFVSTLNKILNKNTENLMVKSKAIRNNNNVMVCQLLLLASFLLVGISENYF